MGELRAYALAVAELRGIAGATGARADHLRTIARQAFAPQTRPPTVRDRIGPLYRRVPGTPLLRTDDATPEDLEALLAGDPAPAARAASTWRLLEGVVAGLAWSSTVVTEPALPTGLLAPTGLPLPRIDGLTLGWCSPEEAVAAPALATWLGGFGGWDREAERAARPHPDVIAFQTR